MFSFFDSGVVPGFGDSAVSNATSGSLLLARGLSASAFGTEVSVVSGDVAARRVTQRIPPAYVVGGVTAYLARLALALDSGNSTVLRTDTDSTGNGSGAGPELTTAAEANLGFVVRNVDGDEIWLRMSDLAAIDADEPYVATGLVASGSPLEFTSSQTVDLAVVDISNSNVDWTNRQFQRLTPFSLTLGQTVYGAAYLGASEVSRVYLGQVQIS